MIRPDHELHELKVAQWTRAEAVQHLAETFDCAARSHPDLMEPYVIRLAGADEPEWIAIMRQGLRETIRARHPLSRLKKSAQKKSR